MTNKNTIESTKLQRWADIQQKINEHTAVGKYSLLAQNKTTKHHTGTKNPFTSHRQYSLILLGLSREHNIVNIMKAFGQCAR